jgi:hypothetical protein
MTLATIMVVLATGHVSASSPRRGKRTLMRTLGFTQLTPSFLYLWCHVPMQIRPVLPRNNFAVPRAYNYFALLLADRVVTWDELDGSARDYIRYFFPSRGNRLTQSRSYYSLPTFSVIHKFLCFHDGRSQTRRYSSGMRVR